MFRKRHPKVGAIPGTLVIEKDAPDPKIRIVSYNEATVEEVEVSDVEELRQAFDESDVTWVDVQGFGDEPTIRRIGEIFSLHPLAIEDIVNVPHRPCADLYDQQLLLIIRSVEAEHPTAIRTPQVSILLGPHHVITFQDRYTDVLAPVRQRISSGKGPIRRRGADYLAYVVIDTLIDAYYPALEIIGDYLEELEDQVITNPSSALMKKLNRVKNQLVNLRRVIWPQRESLHKLLRDDNPFFGDDLAVFLRDTHDHCVQTSEVVEMYREMVTGLINTYLSSIANRTNDVMKVLTIMASIFIPLTFMAGIYGMNFEAMPELRMKWAYPLLWIVMASTAAGMLLFFWRLGWFGNRHHSEDDEPD